MLKRIVRSYGANATETLTAGALHRRKGGAQSAQQGGGREIYDGVLPAMSLRDWRSNSKVAGGVVALLLGFATAHWVAVAQLPVSKGSADVKSESKTR
jgi:hypothetical protein